MAPELSSTPDVLQSMADALPTHQPNDTTSDLSSSYEALALFTHACMVSLGFRLLGFSERGIKEAECHELAPRLPANWNASFNSYIFVYTHRESRPNYVITVERTGATASIRGRAGDGEYATKVSISIRDYVSNAALPVRITITSEGAEDRSNLRQNLQDVFISEASATTLATLIRAEVIQGLLPGSQRKEDEEASGDAPYLENFKAIISQPMRPIMPESEPEPARPRLDADPYSPLPRPRPAAPVGDLQPPGFEDPYDLNRPPGNFVPFWHPPDRTPFGNIGADDLNPPGLGPHDPLRGGLGMPHGGLPRPGGMRGMYPTFDDPLFDPNPQAPPGARYDPIGPGGHPRFSGRGRGGGNDPFGGGGGFGGFGGFGGGDII